MDKLVACAERVVERNPELAYAQRALCFSSDYTQSMRAMIRGLKCADATPYVRRALLECGVEQCSHIGEMFLRDAVTYDMPGTEGDKRELGLAALRMADGHDVSAGFKVRCSVYPLVYNTDAV